MGQHRETAKTSNDWNLAKSDAISDLISSWDSWQDMELGTSDEDARIAKETLEELCIWWDGSTPSEEDKELFAAEYGDALKSHFVERNLENKTEIN